MDFRGKKSKHVPPLVTTSVKKQAEQTKEIPHRQERGTWIRNGLMNRDDSYTGPALRCPVTVIERRHFLVQIEIRSWIRKPSGVNKIAHHPSIWQSYNVDLLT